MIGKVLALITGFCMGFIFGTLIGIDVFKYIIERVFG